MVLRRTRRPIRRRRVRRARGGGFMDVIRGAHDFIKKNKLISTISGALSGVPGIGGIASAINKGSLALGYGRKRRVVRRRPLKSRAIGGSLRSMLSAAHGFIKSRKLVSGALTHFGHSKLASAASALGYGKRRTRRVRRHRGGAFFTTEQIAAPRFS